MKWLNTQHKLHSTRFALAFVLFVGPVVISTGCGTFGKTAYRTTATASVTVEAAMSAWGRWVTEHKPPAADELKVKNAFDKYVAAVNIVADTGTAYQRAKRTNNGLPEAQVKFNAAVAAASAALADLTNLIVSFGAKV